MFLDKISYAILGIITMDILAATSLQASLQDGVIQTRLPASYSPISDTLIQHLQPVIQGDSASGLSDWDQQQLRTIQPRDHARLGEFYYRAACYQRLMKPQEELLCKSLYHFLKAAEDQKDDDDLNAQIAGLLEKMYRLRLDGRGNSTTAFPSAEELQAAADAYWQEIDAAQADVSAGDQEDDAVSLEDATQSDTAHSAEDSPVEESVADHPESINDRGQKLLVDGQSAPENSGQEQRSLDSTSGADEHMTAWHESEESGGAAVEEESQALPAYGAGGEFVLGQKRPRENDEEDARHPHLHKSSTLPAFFLPPQVFQDALTGVIMPSPPIRVH